jgi:cubilin
MCGITWLSFLVLLGISQAKADNIACDPDLRPRVITDPSGTFQSLNYPFNYPNDADCQWQIVAQPGQVIRLDFTTFDTERGYDIVWFFDGSSILSPVIYGLSGDHSDVMPTNIVGAADSMYVWFTADSSTTATGFNATFTSIDLSEASGACNPSSRPQELTEYSGSFTSPFYNDPYPFSCDCQWLIISQETGGTIDLDFVVFITQANADWVLIYDGNSPAASMLGRLSGQYSPAPTDFLSTQEFMFVRFSSNERVSAAGFMATYTSVPAGKRKQLE